MLSFNVGTVLFFARTVVIESAAQCQTAPPTLPTPSRPGDRWQIQLTDEAMKWLKRTTLVVDQHERSAFSASFRPMRVSVRPNDEPLDLALDAWATALVKQDFDQDGFDWYEHKGCTDQSVESIQSMKTQFETPMIWSAKDERESERRLSFREQVRESMAKPYKEREWWTKGTTKEVDVYVRHLIIRQIGPNLTEWMEVIQRVHRPGRDGSVSLMQLDQHRVDNLRFVTNENGEKRLTDICDLFAHQCQSFLQQLLSGQLPVLQGANPAECDQYMQQVERRLGALIQERKAKQVHQNIDVEWLRRIAIETDEVRALRIMIRLSEVSKERMRWQLEIETKLAQHTEDESKLKQQIADLENALDQSTDALNQATEDHQKQKEELEAELASLSERLETEKEKEKHDLMMMVMYIGGGSLVAFAISIAVWRWRANKSASELMEYELNAQLRRVKEPHPLVPLVPSAHANRLGVHEHPAVRDVFGIKEPWDVTPGEGFHVRRITKGGRTPVRTRAGTDEGDVTITIIGDPINDQESANVAEKDLESGVLEHEGVNVD